MTMVGKEAPEWTSTALVTRLQLVLPDYLVGVAHHELSVLPISLDPSLLLDLLAQLGTWLPAGIIAPICHDRW